jgi:thiol-disulfide isomerase/thioredoxin
MKILFFLSLVFFSIRVSGQNSFLADSSILKALSPNGFRDPNIFLDNFKVIAIDGKVYTSDSLKNKLTFINFWIEACEPCIAEFDALNSLYNKNKNKNQFQFLSFTYETKKKTLEMAEKYHLKYPIFCIEKEYIYKLMFNLGFPTSVITDKSGKIRFIACGGFTDKEKAKERIDSLYVKEIERILNN